MHLLVDADTRLSQVLAHVQPVHIVVALLVIVLISVASSSRKKEVTIVNPPAWFEPRLYKQLGFVKHGLEIMDNARQRFSGKPFRVLTETGEVTVLAPTFAHEIRNHPSLNFRSAVLKDFHAYLPAFAPFGVLSHPSEMLQSVVRKQLTKYLNTVTAPLAQEASFAFELRFGNSGEWQDVVLKSAILDCVARLSSRVFLGEELCRNEAWLKISTEYTVISVMAALRLNMLPSFLRPLVYLFSPECKKVSESLAKARAIMAPEIEKRRKLKAEAIANGKPVPTFNDAIDWADSESKGMKYDPATLQLTLSFAAIHTTTDLLTQTITMLAQHPESIDPLRKEMIEVLTTDGWKKNALYNMKLLDSAIKETQRLKPTNSLGMRRLVEKDLQLSDGTTIPKGRRLAVDTFYYKETTEAYDNPEEFDIFRFRNLREQPGMENKAQLVATGPYQLSFGHGRYACPGRFFAANEVKIALCFMLLKYDWKLAPGTVTDPQTFSATMSSNPATVLQYRRRKEEIDLEALAAMN
ncbi:hypothetical protein NM208_g7907 [Fusarium decemcellulare]|uniref:Uncharacterized protein n=1 Tax=Fusarium decemcellulare TaxID=57161 RepID=A0ACC1S7F4_9HYPO|nr:hypothetical protein NM208_g7907 [Fusarium decemcellulare]